jgi:hypothetical protein
VERPQHKIVEAEERNSLKAAIEKARMEGASRAPARSPAEIMREKKGNRTQPQSRPQSHAPQQQTQPQPQLEVRADHEESQKRSPVHHGHDGEVSPHVLQQVINGRHRDADDF